MEGESDLFTRKLISSFGRLAAKIFTNDLECQIGCETVDLSNNKQCPKCAQSWCKNCITLALRAKKVCPNGRNPLRIDELQVNRTLNSFLQMAKCRNDKCNKETECQNHKQEYEAYCEDCTKLICSKGCIEEVHYGHKFIKMKRRFENLIGEVEFFGTKTQVWAKTILNNIKIVIVIYKEIDKVVLKYRKTLNFIKSDYYKKFQKNPGLLLEDKGLYVYQLKNEYNNFLENHEIKYNLSSEDYIND